MVANTFTTEFSPAGARSASAPRAAARGTTTAWKLQSKQKLINPIRLEDVMCAVRVLFPIDREGEQGVARIDVHHPVHDGRSTVVQGTAARLDTVLGWKVLCRVEVPQDLAVDGGISEQLPSPQLQAGSGAAVCQRATPVVISSAVKLPEVFAGCASRPEMAT